jgi:DNA-binding LytR/AlgR family response regulator
LLSQKSTHLVELRMKILVVEDEPIFADAIAMMLDELGYQDVTMTDNAIDALRLYASAEPDLVLLDIRIKGEQDGIAIADHISQTKKPVPIIFMTSMRDKNVFERAKNTNPIAYLIKPFEQDTLERNIELAIYKQHHATWDTELAHVWSEDILADDSLFVKNGQKLVRVLIQDIAYITAEAKYVELHLKDSKLLARVSLNDLLHKLPVQQFVRIKRNQIVNTRFVANIDLEDDIVTLSTGETMGIGRSYRDDFLQRLKIV